MTDLDAFLAELAAHAYGWPQSLRFTYDTAARLLAEGVPGAFVECGVANGVHPAAMARAILDHAAVGGPERVVHLFDSFEGLPHCGPRDGDFLQAGYGDGSGDLTPIGVSACSLTDVRNNLTRWGVSRQRFAFHDGWFQDTLPRLGNLRSIAFLRLDGDLYESTRVCLEHLYPLVSSGGVVVVDDFNLDGCRQAVCDYLGRTGQLPHTIDVTALGSEPETVAGFHPTVITFSRDVWWTKL